MDWEPVDTRTNDGRIDRHPADGHDLIRVQVAPVNNLHNVTIEIPKRRLTVFTGVSGSRKSSLVFGTIAAESLTYPARREAMGAAGREEAHRRFDLATQSEQLGEMYRAAIARHATAGAARHATATATATATDANANAVFRILFGRLGQAHIGSPNAFPFNTASVTGPGAITVQRGAETTTEKRTFSGAGGM